MVQTGLRSGNLRSFEARSRTPSREPPRHEVLFMYAMTLLNVKGSRARCYPSLDLSGFRLMLRLFIPMRKTFVFITSWFATIFGAGEIADRHAVRILGKMRA